jgi:hypothetical protein
MSLNVYLCYQVEPDKSVDVFDANITHNLNKMAEAAGIYEHLWRPDEIGATHARELIEPLEKGLQLLRDKPEWFRQFNSPNGWGVYENFIPFVEKYLEACKRYPGATVIVSR